MFVAFSGHLALQQKNRNAMKILKQFHKNCLKLTPGKCNLKTSFTFLVEIYIKILYFSVITEKNLLIVKLTVDYIFTTTLEQRY